MIPRECLTLINKVFQYLVFQRLVLLGIMSHSNFKLGHRVHWNEVRGSGGLEHVAVQVDGVSAGTPPARNPARYRRAIAAAPRTTEDFWVLVNLSVDS